jgi:hypothetical protein
MQFSQAHQRSPRAIRPRTALGASVAESARAPKRVVQFRDFFEFRPGDRTHDQLGDSLTGFERNRLTTEVDQKNGNLAPIV